MTNLEFRRKTPPGRFQWAINDREHAAGVARLEGAGREILALDVDFGLYVAQQDFTDRRIHDPTRTALPMLFHRAVELLDAVDVLLAAGASLPARVMARSFAEAVLCMRYLDTRDEEDVSAAYLLASAIEKDEWPVAIATRGFRGPKSAGRTRETEAKFRAPFAAEVYWQDAREALERLRREEGPTTPWFRVRRGPRDIAELMSRIPDDDLSHDLRIILARWCQTVHSTDWSDSVDFEKHADPHAVSVLLYPLRHLHDDFGEIVFVCHELFCAAIETVMQRFEPDGIIEWKYAIKRLSQEK